MKITGGIYKGTKLIIPKGADIRPALARVRNSLFNILHGQFNDKKALDLFAGTGSFGLEALSHGASKCLFVENNRTYLESIRQNIAKLRLQNFAETLFADSFNISAYLHRQEEIFDCVFIAPPYKYYDEPSSRNSIMKLIADLSEKNIICPGGMLILEHRLHQIKDVDLAGYHLADRREYGQTCLTFLKSAKR